MKKLLVTSRLLLMVPVVGMLLLTLGVVIVGTGRIIQASLIILSKFDFSAKAAKLFATAVIETIDLFLVGTVAYITALGLYKLFISDEKIDLPIRLKIQTLKDLEDKIIGVIVAALAVAFLGAVASTYDYESILYYGGGISLVIIGLAVFMWLTSKVEKEAKSGEKEE